MNWRLMLIYSVSVICIVRESEQKVIDENDSCIKIIPRWPDAQIPGPSWPITADTIRQARRRHPYQMDVGEPQNLTDVHVRGIQNSTDSLHAKVSTQKPQPTSIPSEKKTYDSGSLEGSYDYVNRTEEMAFDNSSKPTERKDANSSGSAEGGNYDPYENSTTPAALRGSRSAKCGGHCTCEGEEGLLLVDCSRAESPSVLTKDLRESSIDPRTEVRLVIMGSELAAIHSLGNKKITRAHFKYNPGLSYIASDSLKSSSNTLLILDLRNNNLTSPLDIDGRFTKLQFLSLDDNALDTIPKLLSGCQSLVHLSLANNLIRHVTFSALSLPNLQFLNLHKNRLTSPPENMRLPMLRSIVLQGNQINNVPPDVFTGLPSLEYLDLSYSNIRTLLPRSLVTPTTKPWLLSLAHTPLTALTAQALGDGVLALWVDLRGTEVSSLEEPAIRPLLTHMAEGNVVHADWGRPQLWLHNSALSCDCSAKWLATNATLLRHASGRCNDKHIQLRFLDPDYFNVFCF